MSACIFLGVAEEKLYYMAEWRFWKNERKMHGSVDNGRNREKSSSEIPPDLFLGLLDFGMAFFSQLEVFCRGGNGEGKGRGGLDFSVDRMS